MNEIAVVGSKEEKEVFKQVYNHYVFAREDLEQRIKDFDKKDILFRSYIDKNKWPYRSLVFDPRTFTALYEKTARLLANKPRGRMTPREGGDALGAKINNELLSFEWDDNERVDNIPMLAKWALMDLNTRKYGAAFGLAPWHWQRQVGRDGKVKVFFDGPNFRPFDNRDCLANPSYSTIKNWFQHRDYLTLQELENSNNAARSKPIYKNLDILRQQMQVQSDKGGDRRDNNYVIKNKVLKGLSDYLGADEVYRTIEVITEYRPERWITFSPKHGVILRDIPNPYDHGQIPIVQLKYYPIDDDLYGLSEIEPIERLQNAVNALVCQYLDAINISLYTPLKINQTGGAVQQHTLRFEPGAKWFMNDPSKDVIEHQSSPSGVTEFASTYRFMIGAMQEALGETSQGVSNLNPTGENKTATEIKDTAMGRSARDNFNRIFLEEALKKQMTFWLKMNQQLLFQGNEQQKIIRIVGKDAIRYFQETGLDGEGFTDESIETLSDPNLVGTVLPTDLQQPLYPVNIGGEVIPKFVMEDDNQTGSLVIEPDDLSGTYDYVPDVGSMSDSANEEETQAKLQTLSLIQQPAVLQLLMAEQKRPKMSDLLIDYLEDIGFKNADQYFEQIQPMGGVNGKIDPATGQPIQGGAISTQASPTGTPNGQFGGMGASGSSLFNGQTQPVVS